VEESNDRQHEHHILTNSQEGSLSVWSLTLSQARHSRKIAPHHVVRDHTHQTDFATFLLVVAIDLLLESEETKKSSLILFGTFNRFSCSAIANSTSKMFKKGEHEELNMSWFIAFCTYFTYAVLVMVKYLRFPSSYFSSYRLDISVISLALSLDAPDTLIRLANLDILFYFLRGKISLLDDFTTEFKTAGLGLSGPRLVRILK
jgi:hypothetical protein